MCSCCSDACCCYTLQAEPDQKSSIFPQCAGRMLLDLQGHLRRCLSLRVLLQAGPATSKGSMLERIFGFRKAAAAGVGRVLGREDSGTSECVEEAACFEDDC